MSSIMKGLTSEDQVDENLRDWFKEKWVRFGPDGKIRGDCARGDDSEGKPKCLPQSKAHSLGKKGRASAAARKRRKDPNPERKGKAINVNTKKKTNEEQLSELKCWDGYTRVKGVPAGAPGSCKKKTNEEVMEEKCPECGGPMYHESMMNEKKDACYHKVRSRYKVWPSAYASGALVQCRKKGASNWGKTTENSQLDADEPVTEIQMWNTAPNKNATDVEDGRKALKYNRKLSRHNLGNGYTLTRTGPDRFSETDYVYVVTNEKNNVTAYIYTDKKGKAEQVKGLYANRNNKYPMYKVYAYIVKNLGVTLMSDTMQSDAGKATWRKLSAVPGVEIYGWRNGQAVNLGDKLDSDTDADTYTDKYAGQPGVGRVDRSDNPDPRAYDTILVATSKLKEQDMSESVLDRVKSLVGFDSSTPKIKIIVDRYPNELYVTLDNGSVGTFTFTRTGKNLEAEDIWVRPEYRGQGLAKMVYDKLKEKGYTIQRSEHQTRHGKHFWDKNRPDSKTGAIWEGIMEGYSLKKTSVFKHVSPGNPDDYMPDMNIKDTDYEIINNKTGQVVGIASWTTNDYFGPGALQIKMKNGATRYLDIWDSEKGNPQSAFNRFVKDPKTAKKYKDEMTESKLDESKGQMMVTQLVHQFYADNNIGQKDFNLYLKEPGTRVWTRGDGRRYRDPGRIEVYDNSKASYKMRDAFWEWLLKQPGIKRIGKVSGEFGSSPFSDAYAYRGLYFSRSQHGLIEWGSLSRLRNTGLWRSKKDDDITESNDKTLYGLSIGDTVNAKVRGGTVQGKVIDIFPDSMQVELLLNGPGAGKTITVDVRSTQSIDEGFADDWAPSDWGLEPIEKKQDKDPISHHRQKYPFHHDKSKQGQPVSEAGQALIDPEQAYLKARNITKMIKRDELYMDIITKIQLLAEQTEFVDQDTVNYAVEQVHEAHGVLEDAIYRLEDIFAEAKYNKERSQPDEEDLTESFKLDEMPDTSGPVGTQPGGWRRTDKKKTKESSILKGLKK